MYGPWLATILAAVLVFGLVVWRFRAPRRPAPRGAGAGAPDAALARVNGPFDAEDQRALEARLTEAFALVLTPGAAGGFAIADQGDRYVQLAWGGDEAEIVLEAVSDAYLAPERHLDGNARVALASLGFPPASAGENYQQLFPPHTAGGRLARLAARALTEALGAKVPGRFGLTTSLDE